MKHLEEIELTTIQKLVSEFNQLKIQLGDTVITQNKLLTDVSNLKEEYATQEQVLIKKYGSDAVINIQTGEITEPEPEPNVKK
tara:strand:+ start:850 stop:1098 length:249 start_codon:yes stop_codon:yes gene_type:complete